MWAKTWACGQKRGQVSTTNNFAKLFVCQLIVEAFRARNRATLLFLAIYL